MGRVLLAACLLGDAAMALQPAQLRCEYLVDPVGCPTATPRLSWIVTAAEPNQRQTAYQIRAAADRDAVAGGGLWDTGRVESSETLHHVWAGRPLRSRDTVWWSVRVWDQAGRPSEWSPPASFRVGLLAATDWSARWIGPPGEPPAAGRDHNGYHSELAAEPDTVKWVRVDLGAARAIDAVVLHPARPFNWSADVPGFLFPVRYRVEAATEPDFAAPSVIFDGTAADQPNPGDQAVRLPAAVTAQFVRVTATRLAERDPGNHALALAELEVYAAGDNVARGADVTALDSIETAGWSRDRLTDGETRAVRPQPAEPLPATQFRRAFAVDQPIRRATIYATARGLYELWLNGRRVGDQRLAPEWTDYRQRLQVQAYDVTELVRPGANALGAVLGDGWFAGRIGLRGAGRWHYGALPSLLCQLEIELADGTRQTVAGDGLWRMTGDGPIRRADILDGEVYDGRQAFVGWTEPAFDDGAWPAAAEVPPPAAQLVMQPNEPIAVIEDRRPVAVTQPEPGVFIADLGQVMVGWCRFTFDEPRGREIVIRHGEMLNPDGSLYTENLRGAAQIDRYISPGHEVIWEPRFTYHGFRYVELRGLSRPPELVGRVLCSSSRETLTFDCSEPMLVKLMQAIRWTQRGNLHSLPTDCPQRDERLGWMGDIQSFGPTAMYGMDLAAFFTKWLADVREAQDADGRYPDFAPLPPGTPAGNAPAWADAGVILPWHQYTWYADRTLLAAHYDSMRRFIDLIDRTNPDGLWTREVGADYSDWLNGDTLILDGWPPTGGAVPKPLFATAFYAHSTGLLARMAAVLGRADDAARYAALRERIVVAFRTAFVGADGRLAGDTQAGYALALAFGLLPAELEPRAVEHLAAAVERYDGHLSTGIQSTIRLMNALRDHGRVDLAYRLLLQRDIPSWGYMVDHGGTTIWERWDGWVEGRGFQNPGMNSFCHWAFGAVGEWMVQTILGLRPDPEQPGFARAIIAPQPGGGLTWARGTYESIRGTFAVDWRIEAGQLRLVVDIPANCTAEVRLPGAAPATVGSGRHTFSRPLG